jgi:hypothetical protein
MNITLKPVDWHIPCLLTGLHMTLCPASVTVREVVWTEDSNLNSSAVVPPDFLWQIIRNMYFRHGIQKPKSDNVTRVGIHKIRSSYNSFRILKFDKYNIIAYFLFVYETLLVTPGEKLRH